MSFARYIVRLLMLIAALPVALVIFATLWAMEDDGFPELPIAFFSKFKP